MFDLQVLRMFERLQKTSEALKFRPVVMSAPVRINNWQLQIQMNVDNLDNVNVVWVCERIMVCSHGRELQTIEWLFRTKNKRVFRY